MRSQNFCQVDDLESLKKYLNVFLVFFISYMYIWSGYPDQVSHKQWNFSYSILKFVLTQISAAFYRLWENLIWWGQVYPIMHCMAYFLEYLVRVNLKPCRCYRFVYRLCKIMRQVIMQDGPIAKINKELTNPDPYWFSNK